MSVPPAPYAGHFDNGTLTSFAPSSASTGGPSPTADAAMHMNLSRAFGNRRKTSPPRLALLLSEARPAQPRPSLGASPAGPAAASPRSRRRRQGRRTSGHWLTKYDGRSPSREGCRASATNLSCGPIRISTPATPSRNSLPTMTGGRPGTPRRSRRFSMPGSVAKRCACGPPAPGGCVSSGLDGRRANLGRPGRSRQPAAVCQAIGRVPRPVRQREFRQRGRCPGQG